METSKKGEFIWGKTMLKFMPSFILVCIVHECLKNTQTSASFTLGTGFLHQWDKNGFNVWFCSPPNFRYVKDMHTLLPCLMIYTGKQDVFALSTLRAQADKRQP